LSGIEVRPSRVAVLGAGLAGLRGADVLSEAGVHVTVIEKEESHGGLAATVHRGGFRFDLGPHRFHTTDDTILGAVRELLPEGLMELERISRIRLLDKYFRYPLSFVDVLEKMPLRRSAGLTISYALERLRGLAGRVEPDDFRGWVQGRFGRRLYDLYFGPYTEKLWGCPPEELSADWASQRITVPRLTELVRATLFPGRSSARTLVSRFHYPRGGIGRIADGLASRVVSRGGSFLYSASPKSIMQLKGGGFRIHLDDGELEVDAVLSSIPVTEYAGLLGGLVPDPARESAGNLRFRAIVFVVLKLRKAMDASDHWIYIPESRYLFNRISFPGNFDPGAEPEGSQLVFEFTCDPDDGLWTDGESLAESAARGGAELGLFEAKDVIDSTTVRYEHAYPVYSLGYSSKLVPLLDALDRIPGSITCGRQGLFRYNNMDHSLEMGECAALEILGEESSLRRFPWTSDTWADG